MVILQSTATRWLFCMHLILADVCRWAGLTAAPWNTRMKIEKAIVHGRAQHKETRLKIKSVLYFKPQTDK